MPLDLDAFRASLAAAEPPAGLTPALRALWWDAKGDWDRAHGAVDQEEEAPSAWVHAYLHRVEAISGTPATGTAARAGRRRRGVGGRVGRHRPGAPRTSLNHQSSAFRDLGSAQSSRSWAPFFSIPPVDRDDFIHKNAAATSRENSRGSATPRRESEAPSLHRCSRKSYRTSCPLSPSRDRFWFETRAKRVAVIRRRTA